MIWSDLSIVLEHLRQGSPPYGMASEFTVGESHEIQEMEALISRKCPHLIETDAGCGKSHLLDHIREKALEQGFIVSRVRVNSEQEIRFNCLDQIVGAVFRELQTPHATNERGVQPFMNMLCHAIQESMFKSGSDDLWARLTNGWTWDTDVQGLLESPSVYIALRAWFFGNDSERSLVEDWLGHPWRYYKDRKRLVRTLIEDLSSHFIDPRPPSVLFSNKTRLFHFKEPGYAQSWAALRDIQKLGEAAGFKGLVLLFDDMDDIHERLGNLKFQKLALANLFRFLQSEQFGGKSFFAVNTDFEDKCRREFVRKRQGDYDLSKFDEIPRFRMPALKDDDLLQLAVKILKAHLRAYNWADDSGEVLVQVESIVRSAAESTTEHRPRRVVRAVVEYLDQKLEAHE